MAKRGKIYDKTKVLRMAMAIAAIPYHASMSVSTSQNLVPKLQSQLKKGKNEKLFFVFLRGKYLPEYIKEFTKQNFFPCPNQYIYYAHDGHLLSK